MKKSIVLALAAASVFAASTVSAKDLTGWYIDGSVGHSHNGAKALGTDLGSANTTAANLTVGYHVEYIGFDVGYVDLGSVKLHDSAGEHAKISADGITFGVSGHFNPTADWFISTRVGGFQWHVKADASNQVETVSGTENGTGYYLGVGTGYDISRQWSVGVAYDYYKIKKSYQQVGNFQIHSGVVSLKAEYRF